MDVEPEILLEDGEIFDESDEEVHNVPSVTSSNISKYSTSALNTTLEDGEVNDDEVDYTPLERPHNFTNTYKPPEKISDNDSELSSISESDSDDFSAKKPKVKIKSKKFSKPAMKKKKYDIWSSHVQEDVLAETLVSCDVSTIDRSRDVESYPRHIPFDLRSKLSAPRKQGNKRRHDQKNNKNLSSRRKDDSDEDKKGSERVILDLVTNVNSTNEEVAKDIANKLCEEKDELIIRTVQTIGKRKSIKLFKDTQRIESDGGMLIMNGTRRRTPGGVFIFLLKRDNDVSQEQQKQIFAEERREQTREKKAIQKAKLKAIKEKIVANKSVNDTKLPILLNRADLMIKKSSKHRDRNESESEDFVNPPPSPVTDGKENSNDGMNFLLDSGSVADMDVF